MKRPRPEQHGSPTGFPGRVSGGFPDGFPGGPFARRAARLLALPLMLALVLPPSGESAAQKAPKSNKRLKAVESELQSSRATQKRMQRTAESVAIEVRKLKIRLVALARETQTQEAAVSKFELDIDGLTKKIAAGEKTLRGRRRQMAVMLAALERLALHPPIALVARPGRPVDTVRSAILIKGTLPVIESRSRALRVELAALAESRAELRERRAELRDAVRGLDLRRGQLAVVVQAKARIEQRTRAKSDKARNRVAKLAAEAKDLKDLVRRLEQARREVIARRKAASRKKTALAAARRATTGKPLKPADTGVPEETRKLAAIGPEVHRVKPQSRRRALLPLPAQGRIITRFGQRTRYGTRHRGLQIRTRRSAQVTAPREGDVVYAGPFLRYGQLLIIRHGDGGYILLAGMVRVDAEVGDKVLAGEPVGVMSSSSRGRPTLYVELRRRGQPINPMPWLTANRSRASG